VSENRGADFDETLRRGISLFNDGHFWEAHEAWEEAWLEERGDRKRFLQGLIQLAAAHFHLQRGTPSGGLRLFESSISRLRNLPPTFCGVELASAISMAESELQNAREGLPYPLRRPRLLFADTTVPEQS
jgi:uncharacterized protein